jgi:hypothetical protein
VDEVLEDALTKDFPLVYRKIKSFNCGNGWEPAIRELSSKLEQIIASMPAQEQPMYCAESVKSKRASLCFYMSKETSEMSALIDKACRDCFDACEDCGQPGKEGVSYGWVTMSCDTCFEKSASKK